MFEFLKKYDKIIVTGPQRSGTTICARMIAHDTEFQYIDENYYSINDVSKFTDILKKHNRIVVQAPAMAHVIENFATDDILIVFMIRNIDDIVASQKRINWGANELFELSKYGINEYSRRISEVKYEYWYKNQKNKINNLLEVKYESLSSHKLWVNKSERNNFSVRQYKKEI